MRGIGAGERGDWGGFKVEGVGFSFPRNLESLELGRVKKRDSESMAVLRPSPEARVGFGARLFFFRVEGYHESLHSLYLKSLQLEISQHLAHLI